MAACGLCSKVRSISFPVLFKSIHLFTSPISSLALSSRIKSRVTCPAVTGVVKPALDLNVVSLVAAAVGFDAFKYASAAIKYASPDHIITISLVPSESSLGCLNATPGSSNFLNIGVCAFVTPSTTKYLSGLITL